MQNTNTGFNPREHLMQIKGKGGSSDYLPVQWRLVWFREQCPQGTIMTELVHMDLDKEVESEIMQWDAQEKRMKSMTKHGYGVAVFKATITDGQGGSSTGFGSEKASDFGDFLEKAETKSIGRALAALGYGTQFAPELNEESRIVDAPVEGKTVQRPPRVSKERLNGLYLKGKRAGLYANAEEFLVFAQIALQLDILLDVKVLTDEQANDIDSAITTRVAQAS